MYAIKLEELQTLTAGIDGLEPDRLEAVLPEMYESLRRMAQRHISLERPGHTLSATALVHEAYIKLDSGFARIPGERDKFLAISSRMMRQVLVDHARKRNREKRGGGLMLATYTESFESPQEPGHDILQIDELLQLLEAINPRHCQIVECRFFSGMSIEETARALGVSEPTVKRGWRLARAWLKDALM